MHIEIWSDIACPWCYIGKRRLETALSQFEHRDEVTLAWRSFELDPQAPAERDGDLVDHLAAKYGISVQEAQQSQRRLTDLAAAEGLDFHMQQVRGANTFDAHRLVHLGASHGVQDEVKERLLRAYFVEGQLLSDRDTLARLGAEAGVPEQAAREMLAGDSHAEEVREDERLAHAFGISSVPTFVIDRRLGVSGAQPPEALLQFLRSGWERPATATAPAATP